MSKLHTPTHDIPALEQRLKDLLAEPPRRVAAFLPKPSLAQRIVRRLSAAGPVPRKMINYLKAWRLTGYSMRWLMLSIPKVRPFARRVRAFLYFRRQVMGHLQRLDGYMQHLDESLRQLHKQQSHEQQRLEEFFRRQHDEQQKQFNAMSGQVSMLERIQHDAQHRLSRLEQGPENAKATEAYADYYVALENLYRGESAAIEARFEPYLEIMRDAGAGGAQDPVLDLGCGRGEWLSLLRREGMHALGVDSDAAMLAQARSKDLPVVQGDLLTFIEGAAPESYGAVTAFQVVEHLPLDVLMRMFAAAERALRPGGVLVLETPNPENLQVAAYSFWLDPTHVRPLPPPVLDHFARYFGFIDLCIVRSHPWPTEQHFPEDTPANRHLNKLLFCEQDYALVARKPL